MIKIKLLNEQAKMPVRGSDEAAGLDLFTTESVTIPPGHRALLKTGVAMSLPFGYVGLIWPRSKLAAKMGIDVLAGVIDSDYTGELMISLLNTGFSYVEIKAGDRVAQMIIQKHYSFLDLVEVDELDDTQRGKTGINSSEMRLR